MKEKIIYFSDYKRYMHFNQNEIEKRINFLKNKIIDLEKIKLKIDIDVKDIINLSDKRRDLFNNLGNNRHELNEELVKLKEKKTKRNFFGFGRKYLTKEDYDIIQEKHEKLKLEKQKDFDFVNSKYPWPTITYKIRITNKFGKRMNTFKIDTLELNKGTARGTVEEQFRKAKLFAEEELTKVKEALVAVKEAKNIMDEKLSKLNSKIEKTKIIAKKYKAHAYAHQEKTRDLADDLKPRMQKEQIKIIGEVCPYCQQSIGTDSHLDHIHPVSKGGLSRKENLILICKKCNIKKSDQTLRNFIKNFNLDEHKISTNLELLGKDW